MFVEYIDAEVIELPEPDDGCVFEGDAIGGEAALLDCCDAADSVYFA